MKNMLESIYTFDDDLIQLNDIKKAFHLFKQDLREGKPFYDLMVQLQYKENQLDGINVEEKTLFTLGLLWSKGNTDKKVTCFSEWVL